MTSLAELLAERVVLLDGAMATNLFAQGLDEEQPSGHWNLTHPDQVRAVHDSFFAAGCEVVQTNTFLWEPLSREELRAGVELAKQAASGQGLVAGNLGPRCLGGTLRAFDIACRELAAAGVDWLSLETLSDLSSAAELVERARNATGLEVTACMTLSADEQDHRVLGGVSLAEAASTLEAAGAVALGLNCSAGAEQVLHSLPALLAATALPVIAKPNAGSPRREGGRLVWDLAPESFADLLVQMVELGARAVGGCCGTEASHLAQARVSLNERSS